MAHTHLGNGSSHDPVAINVTAMVDVIFCLSVFFMCSFHFKQLEGKLDAWLPKDRGPNPERTMLPDDVRVIVHWDASTKQTSREVEGLGFMRSDEELMETVLALADGYRNAGKTTWSLVVEAASEVPWQEVVHVMDLGTINGIERIELADLARPPEAVESP